jgi:hypothetical protein
MNRLKTLVSTAALGLMLLALAAGSASATILTDASKNQLKTGTPVTAVSEGKTTLHPPFGSISCEESHFGGKTTNDGATGTSVNIGLESLTWSKCNGTTAVLEKGTLSITWSSGNNGTLSSTGTKLTTELFGTHCIFSTNNTSLGTITGSATTKGNATLDIEATIPRTSGTSGVFCGSTAQWTGAYKFTSPGTLNIDDEPPPPESAVLTDGSGTQLKTGTTITGESESNIVLDSLIGELKCEASHLSGKTSNDGAYGVNVNVNVEAFTWSKCNASLSVLANGTLSILGSGGSNGTLTSTGTELTVVSGGLHCIFKTSATKLGTITGSSTTKGNATLDIEATIPRTGGSSGALCGATAQWTGSYKFTNPSTLNIDNEVAIGSTALTDASKNQLKTGTPVTAVNEGKTTLHPPFGSVSCEESHFGGKTTNDGATGTSVNIGLESLTWSKCNATATVLKRGTLSITSTSGNNGTLRSSGTELTIEFFGTHCIFSTSNTILGTITGSATTGSNATLDISATITRSGGSSGAFCGASAAWTGAYKFTAPSSTLNID